MSCVRQRALPFTLALLIGVAVSQVENRLTLQRSAANSASAANVVPLTINSVPDIDFTKSAGRSGGVYASVRLQAVFEADGCVKEIRPFPMLPYGVPESAAGHEKFADVMPATSDGRFVKELPYGLTEAAIEQVQQIQFTPRKVSGKSVPVPVTIVEDFSLNQSLGCINCTSVVTVIMDGTGAVWRGNTWVGRNRPSMIFEIRKYKKWMSRASGAR